MVYPYKRTIILCFILFILVLLVLNRWDIWWDVDREAIFQYDRLTALTNIGQLQRGIVRVWYQKEFLTHTATTILYFLIGGVIIALFRESKK
jgi:hypothetical protein